MAVVDVMQYSNPVFMSIGSLKGKNKFRVGIFLLNKDLLRLAYRK